MNLLCCFGIRKSRDSAQNKGAQAQSRLQQSSQVQCVISSKDKIIHEHQQPGPSNDWTKSTESDDAERKQPTASAPSNLTNIGINHCSATQRESSKSLVVDSSVSEYWSRKLTEDPEVFCTSDRLLQGLSNIKKLGRGGFGYVFQARWSHVDVAVKFMVTKDNEEGESKESKREGMAKKEVLLSENLRHPNIIQTLQTRRGIITQTWLDKAMSSTTARTAHQSLGGEAVSEESLDNSDAQPEDLDEPGNNTAYESDDGYGSPDMIPQSTVKAMSIQEVMSIINPEVGSNLTVIIMEMADKGTLEAAIHAKLFSLTSIHRESRRWRQMYRAIVRTMRELAQSLSVLHDMEIIHCDLKPSNVLLKSSRNDVRGFTVKVCDFGLSKVEPLVGPEAKESACGTLLYMAPERLNGSVCKASDIYSFGIILYEMATGIEPYSDVKTRDIASGVSKGSLKPTWPEAHMMELRPLYSRCTEYDPADRPCASKVVQQLIDIESQLRNQSRFSAFNK